MIGKDLANKKIVRGYKADEILTSEKRVFDFLPDISPTSEYDILGSWEKFFKEKGVAYVIIEKPPQGHRARRWQMWKHLIAEKGLNYIK